MSTFDTEGGNYIEPPLTWADLGLGGESCAQKEKSRKRKQRDVTFRMWKGGKVVDVIYKGPADFRRSDTTPVLTNDRIFAVDTESLTKGGKLTTVLTTLRFQNRSAAIETLDGKGMLSGLFDEVWREGYAVREEHPSSTRARRRNEKTKSRPGLRQQIPIVLSVWFNLAYDFGRLVADGETSILRTVAAGAETYIFKVGENYTVEVRRMFFGSASAFSWFVRHPASKTIVNLSGIDLCGYWKTTLANSAKSVGVKEKIDIESVIDDVYEKPFEEFTKEEWRLFKEYGLGDVQTHLELYQATAKLLTALDERVIRKTGIIPPSAPGASARILFAKAFDAHPGLEAWERYPAWADQLGADSYFGGRVFRRSRGIFQAMVTYDLKSAYPYMMSLLPDPVSVFIEGVGEQPWTEDLVYRLRGKYGVLVISGESLDDIYPAFRIHDEKRRGRLKYVFGKFQKLAVTIPEILIGIARGALKVDTVHDGCIMQGSAEKSFIRKGILDLFAIKENKTLEKALNDMAKLMMNSGYGKFIEVQENEYMIIDQMIMPTFREREKIASSIAWIYANGTLEDYTEKGRNIFWGTGDKTTQKDCQSIALETFVKLKTKNEKANLEINVTAIEAYIFALERIQEPDLGTTCRVSEYLSSVKGYKAGAYFMPLYASQITGCTSAKVGAMAAAFHAYQGDTDSVHVYAEKEKLKDSYDFETYMRWMNEAGYPQPIDKGDLGSWEEECKFPSTESVLARTKLYSHKFVDPKTGEVTFKQAHHGLPKFFTREVSAASRGVAFSLICSKQTFEETREKSEKVKRAKLVRATLLHEAIKELAIGGSYDYISRPSPRKLVEATRSGLPVGEFVSREMHATLQEDPNTWVDEDNVTRWIPLKQDDESL
jgi:hypothetical protein